MRRNSNMSLSSVASNSSSSSIDSASSASTSSTTDTVFTFIQSSEIEDKRNTCGDFSQLHSHCHEELSFSMASHTPRKSISSRRESLVSFRDSIRDSIRDSFASTASSSSSSSSSSRSNRRSTMLFWDNPPANLACGKCHRNFADYNQLCNECSRHWL